MRVIVPSQSASSAAAKHPISTLLDIESESDVSDASVVSVSHGDRGSSRNASSSVMYLYIFPRSILNVLVVQKMRV